MVEENSLDEILHKMGNYKWAIYAQGKMIILGKITPMGIFAHYRIDFIL